jgi:hypothetical protein
MRKFLKALRIRPIFKKEFKFIGLLPFDYGEGIFIMILPMLGFRIDWNGILESDLNKLGWR